MKTFNEFVKDQDEDCITLEEAKRRERIVLEAFAKDEKEWKEHPENFYVGEEAWKAIKRL